MENITTHLIEETKKIRGIIGNYLTLSILLNNFIAEPVDVANKIAMGEYSFLHKGNSEGSIKNLEDDFKEILKGLNAVFTQSKAVEVGVQKITSYIEELRVEIISETNELQNLIKLPETTLENNVNSLDAQPFDIQALERRSVFYNSSLATKEYMTKKTIDALRKMYLEERLEDGHVKAILSVVNDLADKVDGSYDFDILNNAIKVYESKLELLAMKEKNPAMNMPEFDKLFAYEEADLTTNKMYLDLPSLVNVFKNINIDGETSVLEYIDTLIQKLPRLLNSINNNISTYKELVEKAYNVEKPLIGIVDTIKQVYVDEYAKGDKTAEEFLTGIATNGQIANGYASCTNNLAVAITTAAIDINKSISIYDVLGNLLDELTIYGTIDSGK